MAKKEEKKKGLWWQLTHTTSLTQEEYKGMIRKISLFIGAFFLLSVVVFLIIAWIGGINQVVYTIESANLWLYALAFASVFIGYLLSFVKWSYFLQVLKIKVPIKENFFVYMSLYSMELTPGRIGRVLTAYTLNRLTNVRFINIVPIVTMDIFTDFLGIALLALIAAFFFSQYFWYVVIVDVILLLPFLFFLNPWFFKILKSWGKPDGKLRTFTLYGDEYFNSQSKLNKPSVYIVSVIFTLPSAFFYALSLYFSLMAIGAFPALGSTASIYSLSQVLGMVSTLPGNIGVTDGFLVGLLSTTNHLATAVASAVTIMTRIASLWFGVVVGGIFLLITMRYWKPKRTELKRR